MIAITATPIRFATLALAYTICFRRWTLDVKRHCRVGKEGHGRHPEMLLNRL